MKGHWRWRLVALLPALLAGMPALAQQAIVDTAKPFTVGAVEREQYLRGPVGWPTFQEGQAGGMFFRFDPDGYARFGPTERLDQDYWEVVCEPSAAKCAATIGPVHLSIGKDGRPLLKVDGAGPDARFRLDAPGEPVVAADDLSKPEQADALLATTSLTPVEGGEPMPTGGLETVAAFLRWIENGQADDLRLDAMPRRPFPALPARKPDTAATPTGTPPSPVKAPATATANVAAPAAQATVEPAAGPAATVAVASPAASVKTAVPAAPTASAAPAAVQAPSSPPVVAVPSVQVPIAAPVQAPPSGQAAAPAAGTPAARAGVAAKATAPAKPAAVQAPPAAAKAAGKAPPPAAASASAAAAPAQSLAPTTLSDATAACEPARLAPAEIQKPIDSLRGLPGVHVVTDFLVEPPALKGKLRSGIQAALESRFQAAGIRLLTEEELKSTPGQPQLELYLTPGDPTKGCVFRVWMSLRQEVVLVRDTSIHLLTGTWGDGGVARPEAGDSPELGTFIYYIDRFVADYQTANSGTPAAAKPAATASALPTIKVQPPAKVASADSGEEVSVRAVQVLLRENGYDPGVADGQVGPRTRTAIETFESDHEMPVTGMPSRAVLDRLLARRPDGPT